MYVQWRSEGSERPGGKLKFCAPPQKIPKKLY